MSFSAYVVLLLLLRGYFILSMYVLQVEVLYHHLNKKGISCWMAAFEMSGTESLYNRIVQGLYGCQVVVACVTSHYHLVDVCQRDIFLAENVGRPIIPVVLGDTYWPVSGDIGSKLLKYGCIKLKVDVNGNLDMTCKHLKQLEDRLSNYMKGKAEGDGEKLVELMPHMISQSEDNVEEIKEENLAQEKSSDSKHIRFRSSMSMIELQTSKSLEKNPNKKRRKTHGDLSLAREALPDGVEVDDDGYTLKSARSKSCVII